ncbi:SRRM2 protein homolog rsr-2-like isoform X3 [Saccostrea cucullata]|uniref:SRRM2 protein homolog rsr-2-like isoform X3 n=1 Tax=Saccostrea cuccullata TaxID=36930 RepID=UPI002ED6853F
MWPKGINVLKAMKEMREPDDSWIKFDLVKLKFSSAKKRECEEYNLTTTAEFSSSEEDEPARRQRKKKKYDDFVTGSGIEQTSRSTHEESQTQKKTHNSGSRGLGLSRPPQQPPKKRFTSELSADVDSGKSSKDSRASSAEPMRQKKTTVTSLPTLRRSPRKQVEPRRVQQPSEPHESLSQAARRTAPSHQESSPENSDMEAETHLPQLQRQKKTTVTSLSTLRRSPRKQVETRKVQQPSEPHGSLSQAARRTAPSHQESSPENSDMEAETHLPQLQSPPTSSKRTGGYPMSTERFQRRVIQLLVEIRDNVRQGHVGGRSVEDLGTFVVREYDTLEDFLLFDDSLMETELQSKMKALMRKVGGATVGDHVKNAMKKCLTNGLMAKMNMQGKKGKFAFVSTTLCKLIKESILQSHQDATEAKVYEEMSRFLKYAPGRIGGGGRPK